MPETEDLYEILQVHPSAHPDVIQAAYRRLALLYHPDKNPSQEAAEMMKRLNLAYETLSDPNRRAAYDRTRGAQQRQGAETGSRATHRERPRTSSTTNEPTSQSRAGTPTTPPETRSSKAFRITAGLLGGAVVVGAIIVAAVIASAGRGDGDGEGARSVAFSPTRTPIPVKATSVPTSGGTTGMGLVAPTTRPTRSPTPDLATMLERVKPGVVRIETPDGGGTGFIFETGTRPGALVLTNYHVIKGLDRVNVQVNDSRTYQGKVVGYDTVRDLAVLEICCGEFQALNLNGAENIKPGNEVVAIGYPLWLSPNPPMDRDGRREDSGRGEGVTGAMIRARIWVDGRLAGGLQALLGAPMAAYSGCGEGDGGIGHGKRRSRTGLARVCGDVGLAGGSVADGRRQAGSGMARSGGPGRG